MYDLHEFIDPIDISRINNDTAYNDAQLGKVMKIFSEDIPDIDDVDIVLAGINEFRGAGLIEDRNAADAVRRQLYQLHYWHSTIKIADIGNIRIGASLADSYAAVTAVLKEFIPRGKTVLLLGGSHDMSLAQYHAYASLDKFIEATVIDAHIDLHSESSMRSENFLMEMLTGEPNKVTHYNHIGFQSYFVHPHMLETMDKLRFDCHRVGAAREQLEEMEPAMRNSELISFDIAAIKNADAPAASVSPNGFTGDEACSLMRYAGMNPKLSTLGIYGFNASRDRGNITAMQIAQMIWYFMDGKSRSKHEALFSEKHQFNEYHTTIANIDTVFIQSKKTGRWWMQLPDRAIIPCSYNDYMIASNNEIPERWLRVQERD